MGSFVQQQVKTVHHKLAIWLLPIIVILGYYNPIIYWVGLGIFFLVTSFQLLKSMLFWMLILGGISVVFPPIAPVIFVVMLIFFFMRIGFVIKNWRPFFYGIIFYGWMGFLAYDTYVQYEYYGSITDKLFYTIGLADLFESSDLYYIDFMWIFTGLLMSLISLILLRLMLVDCYKYGYESYVALGIMGSAPVIIISFLLPFLKIHMGDVFQEILTYRKQRPSILTRPMSMIMSELHLMVTSVIITPTPVLIKWLQTRRPLM